MEDSNPAVSVVGAASSRKEASVLLVGAYSGVFRV